MKLKKIEEMVELYYNSNQFVHTLHFLEQAFETPFRMYEELASFYERKGYFTNSPARSYRYRVLLEFAKEYDKQYEAVYRELLTYDMYLRENLKSRPDFARDLATFRERIRSFYMEEEEAHCFLPAYVRYDFRQLARMTHLEPFYFPVWDMPKQKEVDRMMAAMVKEGDPSVSDRMQYVLFDYQERNSLTGDARTAIWSPE